MDTDLIGTLQREAKKMYEQEFSPLPPVINLVRVTLGEVPHFDFPPYMRNVVDDYLKDTSLQVTSPAYIGGMLNHFRERWVLSVKYIGGDGELQRVVEENLGTIPEREKTVLTHRFGLYDERPKTLKETSQYVIGKTTGKPTTPQYVRQVEGKAIRRLRHPTRVKPIIAYLREQWIAMMGELTFKDELSRDDAKLLYQEVVRLQQELRSHGQQMS